jgi:hypothetical protein
MNIIGPRIAVAVAALTLATVAVSAQVNPLGKPNAPANPLVNPPANPVAPDADNPLAPKRLAKIEVPEYVKPGARFVYLHTSSMITPRDDQASNLDGGIARHDVVAVLPDRVLAKVSGIATHPETKDSIVMSTSGAVVTADQVGVGGGSIWATKQQLADLRSVPGMRVSVEDWPMGGKTYRAAVIRFEERDALTIRAFDVGTGLKLSESFGGGPLLKGEPANGGLNRQTQRTSHFQHFRQVDLPWVKAGAKAPAWAATVKRLTYRGRRSFIDNPTIAVPIKGEFAVDERGDDWAIGTVTMTIPDQPPITAKHVQGPASVDAYWMSPAALRDLKPGVLDTDPHLGHVLEYVVQERGPVRLGGLVQRSAKGTYSAAFFYNLEDGVLQHTQFLRRDVNSVTEFELVGRE